MVRQNSEESEPNKRRSLDPAGASEGATGYFHPAYCQSLSEFGTPRFLRKSGSWILERQIPNSNQLDAMGCYPLFVCQDWSQLYVDLEELQGEVVSLAIVSDPFGEYDSEYLRRCFPDRVLAFKDHMVIDLTQAPESFVAAHHRRNARKALERLSIELCKDPTLFAEEWTRLYSGLVARHNIRGLTAFSAKSLSAQLAVPGIVMFRATDHDETVGMTLWYVSRNRAYYHLGAYSDVGYDLHASFALFWRSIEHFQNQGLEWLTLGAGAGVSGSDDEDGLNRFKRGWSTGTRTAFFCGRIYDRHSYSEAMHVAGLSPSDYFPAYRKGEFY